MSDSEQKPEEPVEEKSLVPQEITVRNPDGSLSTRLKDPSSGKFVKKDKAMPSSKAMTKLGRKILTGRIKLDEGGAYTSVFEAMTRYMTQIAMGKAEGDPKGHMAAVQAYKVVLERLVGKVPPSEEELEALSFSGVKVVIIQPPQLQNKEVLKE